MNLLMLTKFYPYGTGEAFIENEIKVFSEYYDKIIVIACEVPKNEQRIRTVPKNVFVYRISAGKKIIDCIFGFLKCGFRKSEELRNEFSICNNLKQRIFLSYFEQKSQRIFHSVKEKGVLAQFCKEPYVLYSYWLFMTARVGILISDIKKPDYMFTRAHRYDLYEERNSLKYLPFRRLLLNSFDKVFPCSDDGTAYLKNKYPEFASKIQTAFLGTIDHGLGHTSSDGVFRIMSCSRIAPEKRVEKIVEALALLNGCNLNIEWTHIGGGKGLEALKKLAHDKLKKINFRFVGNVPNSKVLEFYSKTSVDLFVNVSSSEGLPVSIMEAISFGIPTVATDVGGTCEIVQTGYTGQLIRENFSDKELAEHIKRFCVMHGKREYNTYRSNCRLYWEEHFQAINNYNKLCKQIEVDCKKSQLERNK